MAKWAVAADKGTAVVQSVCVLTAAAANMRRAQIYYWSIGCNGAVGDVPFIHIAQRCTTAGAGAAKTPTALDAADTLASTIVAKDTVTADPTLTANAILAWLSVNQRSTIQWYAPPGGEFKIPATASNGLMFGLSATNALTMDYTIHYDEL